MKVSGKSKRGTMKNKEKQVLSYTFSPVIVKIINEHAEAQGITPSEMLENIVRLSFGLPSVAQEAAMHQKGKH
jgi:hypothetical protein